MSSAATQLEKESLEAHVDLCALRYEALDRRLTNVEKKLDDIADDMKSGQHSMAKVIVGSTATIIAGLLSTIVVILMQL